MRGTFFMCFLGRTFVFGLHSKNIKTFKKTQKPKKNIKKPFLNVGFTSADRQPLPVRRAGCEVDIRPTETETRSDIRCTAEAYPPPGARHFSRWRRLTSSEQCRLSARRSAVRTTREMAACRGTAKPAYNNVRYIDYFCSRRTSPVELSSSPAA